MSMLSRSGLITNDRIKRFYLQEDQDTTKNSCHRNDAEEYPSSGHFIPETGYQHFATLPPSDVDRNHPPIISAVNRGGASLETNDNPIRGSNKFHLP